MDRIEVELSESPVTPAYDTNTDSSEHFLSFGSSSGISCSPWNTSAGVR